MISVINKVNIQGMIKNLDIEYIDELNVFRTRFIIIIPELDENNQMKNVPKWFPIEYYTSYRPDFADKDDVLVSGSLSTRRHERGYEFFVTASGISLINKNS